MQFSNEIICRPIILSMFGIASCVRSKQECLAATFDFDSYHSVSVTAKHAPAFVFCWIGKNMFNSFMVENVKRPSNITVGRTRGDSFIPNISLLVAVAVMSKPEANGRRQLSNLDKVSTLGP